MATCAPSTKRRGETNQKLGSRTVWKCRVTGAHRLGDGGPPSATVREKGSVFVTRHEGGGNWALCRGQTNLGERGYYCGLQSVARAEVPIEQVANHGKAWPRP